MNTEQQNSSNAVVNLEYYIICTMIIIKALVNLEYYIICTMIIIKALVQCRESFQTWVGLTLQRPSYQTVCQFCQSGTWQTGKCHKHVYKI